MYKTTFCLTAILISSLLSKPMPEFDRRNKVMGNIEIVCSHKGKENIFMDKYAIIPSGMVHAFRRFNEDKYHALFITGIEGNSRVFIDNDLDGKVDDSYESNMVRLCDYARKLV